MQSMGACISGKCCVCQKLCLRGVTISSFGGSGGRVCLELLIGSVDRI